jgi:hypothetical protein
MPDGACKQCVRRGEIRATYGARNAMGLSKKSDEAPAITGTSSPTNALRQCA